jgi:amidase
MPTVAFKHMAVKPDSTIEVDGKPQSYLTNIMWAAAATSAGLPASVAPIDRSPTQLPIGVQIIGPFLEDRTTIASPA